MRSQGSVAVGWLVVVIVLLCGAVVWAQGASPSDGVQPDAHKDVVAQLVSQLPIAYLSTKFIDFLLRWPAFVLVTEASSRRAKRLLAGLIALASSLGVSGTYEWVDTGTLTITLTGLTVAGVMSGAWHWVSGWAMQQFFWEQQQARPLRAAGRA